MRILDLGCGAGRDLVSWGVSPSDKITGLDLNSGHLAVARQRFPNRSYLQGAGEWLPFADESFDRVISTLALPYMNIPKALAEIHRVLVPGGGLGLSLHLPSFTLGEFLHQALPKPIPTIFRLYVAANGVFFHCTGRTLGLPNGRTESFQTRRGMTIALRESGFINLSFEEEGAVMGNRLVVEATKPPHRAAVAA